MRYRWPSPPPLPQLPQCESRRVFGFELEHCYNWPRADECLKLPQHWRSWTIQLSDSIQTGSCQRHNIDACRQRHNISRLSMERIRLGNAARTHRLEARSHRVLWLQVREDQVSATHSEQPCCNSSSIRSSVWDMFRSIWSWKLWSIDMLDCCDAMQVWSRMRN